MSEIIESYTYGEDLTEHSIVKFDSEGVVKKATSPLDKACGVAMFAGKKGAKGDVVRQGKALIATSGVIKAGDFLVADENGKACVFTLDNSAFTNIGASTLIACVIGQIEETTSSSAFLEAVINPQIVVIKK